MLHIASIARIHPYCSRLIKAPRLTPARVAPSLHRIRAFVTLHNFFVAVYACASQFGVRGFNMWGRGSPKNRQKELDCVNYVRDRGEGVKIQEIFADVVYGNPLNRIARAERALFCRNPFVIRHIVVILRRCPFRKSVRRF